ncbi:MAG: four helix bundle protein [Prevotellaceae bacterium]|jgi:four helix bundle protein|nr:four helix bundle protein [Prevotellaceae bacterium]
MGEMFSFEKLLVWQKSMKFANNIVEVAENLNSPKQHYRLVEQIEACSVSVPQNIAEGSGCWSVKEYIHFLYIARGSLYECITLITLFQQRKWISAETENNLKTQALEIAKMLNALIGSLKQSTPAS